MVDDRPLRLLSCRRLDAFGHRLHVAAAAHGRERADPGSPPALPSGYDRVFRGAAREAAIHSWFPDCASSVSNRRSPNALKEDFDDRHSDTVGAKRSHGPHPG